MIENELQVIKDYVNGEEIDNYDIDDLEDNISFMMHVINYSNDKNFYNLCSNKVQNNYEFIKFLINKFPNELRFLCDAVNKYMKYEKNEVNLYEILILMRNKIKSEPEFETEFINYSLRIWPSFLEERINNEAVKQRLLEMKEIINENEIGLGFSEIKEKYGTSEVVLDYFAKEFIDCIFDELNINLEYFVHNNVASFEIVESLGLVNYLLKFLNIFDTDLSFYVSKHIYLIDNLKKELIRIKDRWDWYKNHNEEITYEVLFDTLEEYWDENAYLSKFTLDEFIYYIAYELNIIDKIMKYQEIVYTNEEIKNILSDDKFNINNMSIEDKKHYHYIKDMMINIVIRKQLPEVKDAYINENNSTSIIDFNKYKM